jgi:hypothetical protein
MKIISLSVLISTVFVLMCIATEMIRTTDSLAVTIHPNWGSRHNAMLKSFKEKRMAIAADMKESGMVELCFQEGITTTNDTKVYVQLTIPDVVEVALYPSRMPNGEGNTWTFHINPDYIDKTTLTLGWVEGGLIGPIMRKEYKLIRDANHTSDGIRQPAAGLPQPSR